MAIKWTPKQQQRLESAVKTFNDAIQKQINRSVNPDSLPPKLDSATLKAKIISSDYLNQLEAMARNATKKGAFDLITNESGTTDYKFNFDEAKRMVKYINKQREKKKKLIDPSPYRGTMHQEARANLKARTFDAKTITPSNWDAFKASVAKQSAPDYNQTQADLYARNYKQAFMNFYGIMDRQDIAGVIEKIGGMRLWAALAIDQRYSIDYLYPAPGEDLSDRYEELAELLLAL